MTRQKRYIDYKTNQIDKKVRKLERMWCSPSMSNACRYNYFKEIESEFLDYEIKMINKVEKVLKLNN